MADDDQTPSDAAPDRPDQQPRDAQHADIDVARLAEKVYALMREELRLERARGATRARSW
jgi:hypothetical protein